MKVSCSEIQFRIDIDFDGCEVDMALKELCAKGIQTPVPIVLTDNAQVPIDRKKLFLTPIGGSVDFALHWLAGYVDRNEMSIETSKWDHDYSKKVLIKLEDGFEYYGSPEVKTELEEIGISVESWDGLLQGTCHLICAVAPDKYSPELVEKANRIVGDVFKRFVRYYKPSRKRKSA